MSDIAVRVERISKRYHLGALHKPPTRVYEALGDAMKRLWLRARPVEHEAVQPFWALQDISFEITSGEVVGIIGRNGSGKSTLLKILSRVTEPTAGRVEYYGHMGSLLEVGTGFHPDLSGRENIYLNGTILGMKRADIEAKFDDIVAFSEIEQFIDTPVKRYSSGMFVRLAFSVATYLEPEILLLDEVLSVGDVSFQKKSLERMHEIVNDGRTVLFVSHSMKAVQNLCPRTIVIEQGRIVFDGNTEEAIGVYMALNNMTVEEAFEAFIQSTG